MSLTYADVHGELIETLDADLRAVVRAEGVDPQRDASVVRRLAARVVGDHDQRSLTGAVLPVLDPDAVIEELVARVLGVGALQRYLDDAPGTDRLPAPRAVSLLAGVRASHRE